MLIACSIFPTKTAMLTVMFNINWMGSNNPAIAGERRVYKFANIVLVLYYTGICMHSYGGLKAVQLP